MMADSAPLVERMFISSFQGMKDGSRVEIRSTPGGARSRTIGGYAAVFGVESRNMGGFQETVMPVFFNKSRAENWPDVVCRYEHNPLYLLGTTHSGTLRVQTDNMGLLYDVDVPESRSDVLESVGRGDIAHSSFSFVTYEDQWRYSNDGVPLRQLISGKLLDVAPTLQPAYPDATVGLRSLALAKEAPLEDVMALSGQNELRKLFIRTDIDGGAPAKMESEPPADEPKVDEPVQETQPPVEPQPEPDEAKTESADEPKVDDAVQEPPPVEPQSTEPDEATTETEDKTPPLFGPLELMRMLAKKPEPIEE
jgi:HK97 family phage prohead protease